ncbi:hypothetical protein ACP70R_018019 [Stipagrostis hirtigluma subsp. patula]
MQDCVGEFVQIDVEYAGPESLAVGAVFSKDIAFGDHAWTVHCFPRGAPDDDGAGEYLSIHLVNLSRAKNARVLFEASVLGRAAAGAAAASDVVTPPGLYCTCRRLVEYPAKDSFRWRLPKIARTSDLAEHCVVGGHIAVVCGVVVLRHSGPIPLPPSSYAADLDGLWPRKRPLGEPDVSFAVDGDTFPVNRRVLAARSAVFKAELLADGAPDAAPESDRGMPVIRPRHEIRAATFRALLVYIYCDRLPRDGECGGGGGLSTELLRELLAAADLYALDRLKLMCAKKLWEEMSVETVSKTLWYAVRHACPELKKACMDFLAMAENMGQVAVTEEYVWLAQNSPSIVQELRDRVARN